MSVYGLTESAQLRFGLQQFPAKERNVLNVDQVERIKPYIAHIISQQAPELGRKKLTTFITNENQAGAISIGRHPSPEDLTRIRSLCNTHLNPSFNVTRVVNPTNEEVVHVFDFEVKDNKISITHNALGNFNGIATSLNQIDRLYQDVESSPYHQHPLEGFSNTGFLTQVYVP